MPASGWSEMTEAQRCSFSGCEQVPATSLDTHPFCREHFISTCYERLDECERWLGERPFHGKRSESMRNFLTECNQQVLALNRMVENLTNLERARLSEIAQLASALGRRMRRSPRMAAFVPVRLHSKIPGHPWEEETKTRSLSRYGALLECQNPIRTGERLLVVREGTGLEADARVVWNVPKRSGRQEVAIEFLNCDNFWELDWSTSETAM